MFDLASVSRAPFLCLYSFAFIYIYCVACSGSVRSLQEAYKRSQARYARQVAALKVKLASAEERASLGRYSGARHTREVTDLQRTVSNLEKELKKARSKFEAVVGFNDQLKQNLATVREDLAALRRDLVVARERVGLLELRGEAHAEDQLVIDELREELASLSFAISEKDEHIRRIESSVGQTSTDAPENANSILENLGTCPFARTASI